MYLECFGLQEFPFSLAPDPRFLYLSGQHREALAHLLYGVVSEGGFVQLTGEVGTGKTTVCRCFLERLPAGTEAAVVLNPRLSAEELVAAVCDEFRIPPPPGPATVKSSLDRLNAFLLDVHAGGRRAVLVIDEAQNLDVAALELVRLLTNLETSRHKLLQIVLVGQPELRDTLARTELRQLAQRITARFHLGPLSRGETAAYVSHRLAVAGGSGALFPPAVIPLLRRLSGGVPRLVNIIADRALLGSFAEGRREVDAATLRRAAREVAGDTGGAPGETLRRAAAVAAVVAGATLLGLSLSGRGTPEEPAPTPFPPGVATAVPEALPERAGGAPGGAGPGPGRTEPAAGGSPDEPRTEAGPETGAPTPSVTPRRRPAEPPAAGPTPPAAVTAPAPAGERPAGGDLGVEGPAAAGATSPDGAAALREPAPAVPEPPPPPPPGASRAKDPAPPPSVPAALGAILQLPEAREEGEALRRLFALWGEESAPASVAEACERAAAGGLSCRSGAGRWEDLLRLDRPGVVHLRDGQGPAWLLLEGSRGGQVRLAAGGARTVVDADRLAGHRVEGYVLVWRPASAAGVGGGGGDVVHP